MGINIAGFEYVYTAKVTSISTTSQAIQIPDAYVIASASTVVVNDTDQTIFVKKGRTSPTATETGEGISVILAGQAAVIGKAEGFVAVYALSAATGTVYVTVGN